MDNCVQFQNCSATCSRPMPFYNLQADKNNSRDFQNDRINSQLEMLLEHQQQWNVVCDAELSKELKEGSPFLDVCTALNISLRAFTEHMIDYVSNSIS